MGIKNNKSKSGVSVLTNPEAESGAVTDAKTHELTIKAGKPGSDLEKISEQLATRQQQVQISDDDKKALTHIEGEAEYKLDGGKLRDTIGSRNDSDIQNQGRFEKIAKSEVVKEIIGNIKGSGAISSEKGNSAAALDKPKKSGKENDSKSGNIK